MGVLEDFKAKNPDYQDIDNPTLADALYNKYYSSMPRAEFDAKVGLSPSQPEVHPDTFWGNGARKFWQNLSSYTPPEGAADVTGMPAPTPEGAKGSQIALGELGKGVPIAGALVTTTPAMKEFEEQHPGLAKGTQIAGGALAMAPAVAAAPALFGAGNLPLIARTGISALSAGTIGGADKLARGGTLGEAGQSAGLSALIGGGMVPGFAGLGAVASPVVRAIMRNTNPVATAQGVLKPEGEALARSLGLDIAKMTPDQIKQFAGAADKQAAAQAIKSQNEFGIEATLGQRTKDPQQLHAEEQMRRGLMGQPAKEIMQDFDARQKGAIASGAQDFTPRPGQQTIPGNLAPDLNTTSRQELGSNVAGSMKAAHGAAKEAENAAWDNIGLIHASDAAKGQLPAYLQKSLGEFHPVLSPEDTPTSLRMGDIIRDYMQGKPLRSANPVFGELPPLESHVDQMRRALLKISQGAKPGPDRAAAGRIYDGFNEWANDLPTMGNGALKSGSSEDLAKIVAAREVTRNTRNLFAPTNPGSSTLSPAGRILESAYSEGATPESVITKFVGTGPKSTINDAQVQALQKAKQILNNAEHQDAWNSLRIAYWSNLTRGPTGRIADPGVISNRIETAFNNQKTILDTLYSSAEQAAMRNYQSAINSATYKPPNASGSSYGMQQKPEDSIAHMLLEGIKGMGGRALMEGKGPLGSLFDFALTNASRVLHTPEQRLASQGAEMARRAVNQAIPQAPRPQIIEGLGGALTPPASSQAAQAMIRALMANPQAQQGR